MDTTTSELFFELLRAGLWGRPADLHGQQPTDAQWADILQISREQTVMGVIFDGLSTLPPEQMPPRQIKFTMAADVSVIEHRNAVMRSALRSAAELFDANGLSYMLLKGAAVAEAYPVPEHRVSGDIDFYLPLEDCEKTAPLLFKGKSVEKDRRHISGDFQGVHIENHFELTHYHMKRYVNFCREILGDDIRLPLSAVTFDGYKIVCPSPTFHTLFILEHIVSHLLTGLGLRQIIDWAAFLHKYAAEIDREAVARIIRKYKLVRISNIFGIICADRLGMPEICAPIPLARSKQAMQDVDYVLGLVMEGGNFGRHYTTKHAISPHLQLSQLLRKPIALYVFFMEYPKYRLISRKLFWNMFFFMIISRFKSKNNRQEATITHQE